MPDFWTSKHNPYELCVDISGNLHHSFTIAKMLCAQLISRDFSLSTDKHIAYQGTLIQWHS